MSILWITLAVLAGAFIVGGTAAYFFRARYLETVEAATSNLQSVAAPVPVAEEVRAIGDQIERAMTESRLQGETQRQLLAQKLDSVRQSVETQRHHVDGIRNELRHEIRRRDAEISEIKTQISTISTTIGLPAPAPAPAALPPGPAAETSEIPALADPALAPPPPADDAPAFAVTSFDVSPLDTPAFEAPSVEVAGAAPAAAEPTLDEEDEPVVFEPASFVPAVPDEAMVPEPVAFDDAFDGAPATLPHEDFVEMPPFVIDPVGDAERDAAEAAAPAETTPEPPALESADAPASEPEPFDEDAFSFVDVPLAATTPAPQPAAADEMPAPAEPDDLAGDSFAEISFQDLTFTAPRPAAAAPETSPFASWSPTHAAPGEPEAPAFAEAASVEEAAPEADVETIDRPRPSADDFGPWVARPGRDAADAAPSGFGEPVHAPASDFLPSPSARPEPAEAVAPAESAETEVEAPPAEAPAAPSPVSPEPVPDHADDLTVISTIDEDLQRLLYAEGIHTLDQIAQMTRTTARRVSVAVRVSEETIMTQWVFEAQSALFTPFATGGSH